MRKVAAVRRVRSSHAGIESRISGTPGGMGGVHFAKERETIGAALGRDVRGIRRRAQMRDGLWRSGVDDRALMIRGEKAGREGAASIVRQAARIRQRDKGGHIVREAAERVRNPRARAGKSRQQKPACLQIRRRAVDVRLRLHGHEKSHLVHLLREVRQRAAHPPPALPVLRPLEGTLHRRAGRADARLHPLAGTGIKDLPVPRDELRLVVEEVALTRPAIHKKLDDALRLGRVMQLRRSGRFALQQRRERDAAQPSAESTEKIAAGKCGHGLVEVEKFIAVDDDVDGVRQAVGLRAGGEAGEFIGRAARVVAAAGKCGRSWCWLAHPFPPAPRCARTGG